MTNAKAPRLAAGEVPTAPDPPDRQLLERFVATRDGDAFTEIVRRHGGTVWSVCRRVLTRQQDIEDAFQATFLVLARKAAAIRKGDAVGSWLYAVAHRTAMKAKQDLANHHEAATHASGPSAEPSPLSEAALRELQRLLDEQLQRLPERYRAPFILCCLQGLSRTEAARELGWKEGTVSGCVARARGLLQKRLARYGIALSTALTAGALSQNAAAAPPVLLASTAHAVIGKAALSPSAVALAESVLKGMTAVKLVAGLGLLLSLVLGATAALVTLDREPATGRALPQAPSLREAHTLGKPAIPLLNPTDERVLAVAVTRDGKRLATVGAFWPRPGHVTIWDLADRKALASVRDIPPVRSVAFAPDGRTLATGDFQGMLRLRDGWSGRELAAVKAHEIGINGVAFAPDGRLLATAGLDNLVKLYDATTLQVLKVFTGHTDWVFAVSFFRHKRAFVTGGRDGTLRIWDIDRSAEQATLATGQQVVEALAISPDDRTIASASWGSNLKLWDAETGAEQATLNVPGTSLLSVVFSPDGKRLAATGGDGKIHVWDVKTRQPLQVLEKHVGPVWAVAFTHDGGTLASGGADGTAQLWNAVTGKPVATLVVGQPTVPRIAALAYAPDGKSFAAARGDTVELRDVKEGTLVRHWTEHRAVVNCLAFTADGRSLFSGSEDGNILAWDTVSGKRTLRLQGHASGVVALCCSLDGQTLASASRDQVIKTWDPATGREIGSRSAGHQGSVQVLAFTPDARQLASGGEDGSIKLWDVATGTARGSFRGHEAPVRALAFAADGTLASAGGDATVRLWPPGHDGTPSRILHGHGDGASALLFSPGGHTLVTGSVHGVLTVWDPVAGVPRQHLDQSSTPITALAFDAQGEGLLSGSSGAVLRYPGLPPPPDPPTEALPEKLYYDFRKGVPPANRLPLYYHVRQPGGGSRRLEGADAATVTRADDAGLRITLPADQEKRGVWVQPPIPISGDFDVSVGYDLLSMDRPRNGFGVGVVLLLSSPGAGKMAKLCRLARPIEGECYLADLTDGKKKGQRITTKFVPALAHAGQLRLVREGQTLRYLVADFPDQSFREIHREEFGWHDVEGMKVMVTSHESPAAIDARLIELRVRAGRFSFTPPPPAVAVSVPPSPAAAPVAALTPRATPNTAGALPGPASVEKAASVDPVPSHRPWVAAAAGIFGLLAVAGLVAGLRWRARRASRDRGADAGTGAQTDAPMFLTAICTACGKNLKAAATLAGKKVKCPRCDALIRLPGAEQRVPTTAHNGRPTPTKWRVGAAAAVLLLLGGGALLLLTPGAPAFLRPDFLNVPLGGEEVAGVEESGFGNLELDSHQRPARWTDGRARLIIPLNKVKLPRALVVKLPPSRPAKAPPAKVQIVVNDRVLFNDEIPHGALDKTFDLDPALLGDKLTLDILSNTFVPQALPGSTSGDTRTLGVRVSCIQLLGPSD